MQITRPEVLCKNITTLPIPLSLVLYRPTTFSAGTGSVSASLLASPFVRKESPSEELTTSMTRWVTMLSDTDAGSKKEMISPGFI